MIYLIQNNYRPKLFWNKYRRGIWMGLFDSSYHISEIHRMAQR